MFIHKCIIYIHTYTHNVLAQGWCRVNAQRLRVTQRDLYIWQKRPIHMAKETYDCKADAEWMHQVQGSLKETQSHSKRDLFKWQKRPIHIAKEDLFKWQKRPIHIAKETYSNGKRDLSLWHGKREVTKRVTTNNPPSLHTHHRAARDCLIKRSYDVNLPLSHTLSTTPSNTRALLPSE